MRRAIKQETCLSVCLLSYHLSIYLTIYLSVYLTYLFIHLFQERVSHRLEPSLALNLWQSSRLQPSECWDYSNVSRMCIGFLLQHGFFLFVFMRLGLHVVPNR